MPHPSSPNLPPPPGPLRRALTAWLFSGAPPGVAKRIHAAILEDPTWSAWYDALRRVERAGGPAALGTGQRELLESLVLDAVATAAPAPRPLFRGLSTATPALVAASLSLVLFVGLADERTPATPTLTPRSAAADAPLVGVRVRCLDRQQTQVVGQAEVGPQKPGDRLACSEDNLLTFSLTNLSETRRYVFVVGLNRDGALRWYAPFDREAEAVLVEAGTVDAPLGVAADLASMPPDDRVTLYAVFSELPLTAHELSARLSSAQRRGSLSSALERLPVDVAHQGYIELVRDPR